MEVKDVQITQQGSGSCYCGPSWRTLNLGLIFNNSCIHNSFFWIVNLIMFSAWEPIWPLDAQNFAMGCEEQGRQWWWRNSCDRKEEKLLEGILRTPSAASWSVLPRRVWMIHKLVKLLRKRLQRFLGSQIELSTPWHVLNGICLTPATSKSPG